MLRYILRRLLLLIPLLLAASAIIFLLLRLGAGDPALDYLRLSNLPPTEEMVASTRELLGLNQPLAMQYLHWLWRALHLDFGLSYATQRPVLDDLLHFLPATLLLTGAALALILVTSLPVGHLGGAPSRSPAGLYRTADCLPRRLNAQLLAGLSAGDALFRASAVAPGDGVWRLAAPDIARRLHRLYVAGDQRPPAARQHAGRRQPASRDMGAAARIERAPWSADISCATPPCRW